MVRLFSLLIPAALLCLLMPVIAGAEVLQYTGTMQVVTVSGKACQGQIGTRNVELIISHDRDSNVINGYFEGFGIATGKFSGNDLSRLDVRYPNYDEPPAAGHFIRIHGGGDFLAAELHDRHLEATDDNCSFDTALLSLVRTPGDDATARFKIVAGLFEAQLSRSQGMVLTRSGNYADALPLFEKALAQADEVAGDSIIEAAPYVTGLASVYAKLGRIDDFNKLYDQRIDRISSGAVRSIYIAHGLHFLLQAGRASLHRGEFPTALAFYQKAYQLSPQNREAGAGIVSVYRQTGRHDSAITFLEGVLKTEESESGRLDVSTALADQYFERANRLEKDGNAVAATADLIRADTINHESTKYLIALARLRHKHGSFAEAEKVLQQGLERFPDDPMRQEIIAAHDKMQQTESILDKLRKAGS